MLINDGHKHNIRVVDKTLKCIACGHTQDEIRASASPVVSAPPTVSSTTPQQNPTPPVAPPPTDPVSPPAKAENGILVSVENDKIKVTFAGVWNGKLIKGAIRAIEQEYRIIKHNATRMAVQKNGDERRRQESLSKPVAETKGA